MILHLVFNDPTSASVNENQQVPISLDVEDESTSSFTLSGVDKDLFSIDSSGVM